MEIPDLVREALGDEEITSGVNLGDEDAAVFTPTRTLIYRGERLLSDERVAEYPHDFERLAVSEGRRKSTFRLTYVDDETEFSVPGSRTDAVLERVLGGALGARGITAADEGVAGVFRFSELTLVVTEGRLVKHVGNYTWDGDYEEFPYDEVTRLEFEGGSVATQVVLGVGGRTERIKAPNEQAGVVRQALEEALFAYHDVDSLAQLNRRLAPDEGDEEREAAGGSDSGGIDLDTGIDPLVGGDGEETTRETAESPAGTAAEGSDSSPSPDVPSGSAVEVEAPSADDDAGDPDLAAVEEQLADLTAAVERQSELLERQQQTVAKLIEELRRGR
ncbi:MAG: hypothetical protein ABEJ89_08260 [Haloarculaceae archaeon]